MVGCSAYSGGGGGAKIYGKLFLDRTAEITGTKEVCKLVELHQLEDDQEIVPVACLGRPEALSGENSCFLAPLVETASRAWENCHSREIKVVTCVEIGPANSLAAFYAAALNKAAVLDGDLQGRSVMSLTMLGPYIHGIPFSGTCYAYVPADGKIPEDAIAHTYVSYKGEDRVIVACELPTTTAAESEVYLGTVFKKALPDSVFAIAFGGLKKGDLLNQGPHYSQGTYVPLYVAGTLSRAKETGKALFNIKSKEEAFNPLLENGGFIVGTGKLQNIEISPIGRRSDSGSWRVELEDGSVLIGFYNNETVLVALENGNDIIPVMTAPTILCIQSLENFVSDYSCKIGECFTNDELWNIMKKNKAFPEIQVNIVALPPPPIMLTKEALDYVGPSKWGISNGFGDKYPALNHLQFIPCPTLYKAPSYKRLLKLTNPKTLKPFGVSCEKKDERIEIQEEIKSTS